MLRSFFWNCATLQLKSSPKFWPAFQFSQWQQIHSSRLLCKKTECASKIKFFLTFSLRNIFEDSDKKTQATKNQPISKIWVSTDTSEQHSYSWKINELNLQMFYDEKGLWITFEYKYAKILLKLITDVAVQNIWVKRANKKQFDTGKSLWCFLIGAILKDWIGALTVSWDALARTDGKFLFITSATVQSSSSRWNQKFSSYNSSFWLFLYFLFSLYFSSHVSP